MSAKTFILIEAEVGKSREVVAALKEIEGVTTADRVTGPYDVIAVVEGQTMDEISNIMTGKILAVPGVYRIVSCLALEVEVPKIKEDKETNRYF